MAELRRLDGLGGFFRGAGPLMFREVPFYVFGMVLYEQYKRCFNGSHFGSATRELSTREYIMIGGLAGASASLITTPADVIKSRMMTAAAGTRATTGKVIVDIIQKEGLLALFKGALPRAVWIAPLGAMNFAGYELAKRAMGVGSQEAAPAAAAATGASTRPAAPAPANSKAASAEPPAALAAPPDPPPPSAAPPEEPPTASASQPQPAALPPTGAAETAAAATTAASTSSASANEASGLGATGSITASVTRLACSPAPPQQAPPAARAHVAARSAPCVHKRSADGAGAAPAAKRPRELTAAQRNAAAVALVRARAAQSGEQGGVRPGANSVRRRGAGDVEWAAPVLSVHRALHRKVQDVFSSVQAR